MENDINTFLYAFDHLMLEKEIVSPVAWKSTYKVKKGLCTMHNPFVSCKLNY